MEQSWVCTDYERTQSFRIDWTRDFGKQEVSMGRRNRDWNWTNLGVEDLLNLAQNCQRSLLRSRYSRRTNSRPWSKRNGSVRYALPTFVWTIPITSDYDREELRRGGQSSDFRQLRSRGSGRIDGEDRSVQGRD